MSLDNVSEQRPSVGRWGKEGRTVIVTMPDGGLDGSSSSQTLVRLKSNMLVATLDESLHKIRVHDSSISSHGTKSTAALTVCSVPGKSVQWGELQIREYARILGDNPSCSSGAPIGIGWWHGETIVLSVDEHEDSRPPRRTSTEMLLPRRLREDMLMNEWGVPRSSIASAIRKNVRAKSQRRRTVTNLNESTEMVEVFFESAGRKLKRLIKMERRSSHEIKKMQKQASRAASVIETLSCSSFDDFSEDFTEPDFRPALHSKTSVVAEERSLDDRSLNVQVVPEADKASGLGADSSADKKKQEDESGLDEERNKQTSGNGTEEKVERVAATVEKLSKVPVENEESCRAERKDERKERKVDRDKRSIKKEKQLKSERLGEKQSNVARKNEEKPENRTRNDEERTQRKTERKLEKKRSSKREMHVKFYRVGETKEKKSNGDHVEKRTSKMEKRSDGEHAEKKSSKKMRSDGEHTEKKSSKKELRSDAKLVKKRSTKKVRRPEGELAKARSTKKEKASDGEPSKETSVKKEKRARPAHVEKGTGQKERPAHRSDKRTERDTRTDDKEGTEKSLERKEKKKREGKSTRSDGRRSEKRETKKDKKHASREGSKAGNGGEKKKRREKKEKRVSKNIEDLSKQFPSFNKWVDEQEDAPAKEATKPAGRRPRIIITED